MEIKTTGQIWEIADKESDKILGKTYEDFKAWKHNVRKKWVSLEDLKKSLDALDMTLEELDRRG